ncbi:MAG: vWA domain-containing protein [Candidatus Spechtbacterales bacterium]
MHFERPYALLLLILIPIALIVFRQSYRGDSSILKVLRVQGKHLSKNYLKLATAWIFFLASLAIVAAGPYIPTHGAPDVSGTGDYVIVVDISASTAARSSPVEKSIEEISKEIAMEIVESMPVARFQVFGYTRLAFTLSSFTNNYEELKDTIENSLYINAIPWQGSDLANALGALHHQKTENPSYENVEYVILLSDGNLERASSVNNFKTTRASRELEKIRSSGLKVISVGIGSTDGWNIPLYDEYGNFTGRFQTLREGKLFTAQLNEKNLRQLSSATGGRYFHYENTRELVDFLKSTLSESVAPSSEDGVNVANKQDVSTLFLLVSAASLAFIFKKELY